MNGKSMSAVRALTPGTAVHSKGKQRVKQILKVATEVLAFDGYSAFTMRNIAAKAGISLRNLQYYFQTKSDLFRSVIEQMLERELESAREVIERPGLSDEERFLAFVDYSIRDNESPLIRGFQFELWALATRDPDAAECRDRMTVSYCEFILQLVRPLTPDLTSAEQRKRAAIVLALVQGLPLVTTEVVAPRFKVSGLKHSLRFEILDILRLPAP